MTLPLPPELPPLPAPRARAMVLLWNPDADTDDFAAVMESDPALTSAVLRAANSAISSPRDPVRRVQDAIVRIGLAASRQLLSTAVVRSEFGRLDESRIDTDEMWRHLLVTALVAEEIVGVRDQRAVAFTAGLLHDVGRLAMAAGNAARYAQVVELAARGEEARDAERRVFGTEHAAFGGRICQAWRLPDEFSEAVANHHEDESGGLSGAVVRARRIGERLGFGDGIRPPAPDPFEADDPDWAIVERLGGLEGIARQIRLFRDATAARH